MRRVALSLAAIAASVAVASPALANEGRVEARGGVWWMPGGDEAVAGVAGGYDFDLGSGAFVGLEASADKILTDNTKVAFGATGRVGVKAGDTTKVFAAGGYTTKPCDLCEDAWNLGAGIEQKVTGPIYVKAEYRHFFVGNGVDDSDALVGGIGINF